MTSPASELQQIVQAKLELSDNERVQFDLQLAALRKNPTTALLLSLFFGAMGVDRFYIGDTGLGVTKLLTLGGVGIWAIVDLFLIQNAARRTNIETMRQVRDSILSSGKLSQSDLTVGKPTSAPPREPVAPPISEGSSPLLLPPPLPSTPQRRRRIPRVVKIVVLSLLVLLIVGIVLGAILGDSDDSTASPSPASRSAPAPQPVPAPQPAPAPRNTTTTISELEVLDLVFVALVEAELPNLPLAEARSVSRQICSELRSGSTVGEMQLALTLVAIEEGWSDAEIENAGYLIGIGIGRYCPEYSDQLGG